MTSGSGSAGWVESVENSGNEDRVERVRRFNALLREAVYADLLPGERTRNHRPHDVPLSDSALDVIVDCPRRDGREPQG